jgi:hypothetical protein
MDGWMDSFIHSVILQYYYLLPPPSGGGRKVWCSVFFRLSVQFHITVATILCTCKWCDVRGNTNSVLRTG